MLYAVRSLHTIGVVLKKAHRDTGGEMSRESEISQRSPILRGKALVGQTHSVNDQVYQTPVPAAVFRGDIS